MPNQKYLSLSLLFLMMLSFFYCASIYSQTDKKRKNTNFEISGVLKDSITGKGLEAATVYLESVRDSTLITYTITNSKGFFLLEGQTQYESTRVNTSFVGYEPYSKEVTISETPIDLGAINIGYAVSSLDEVVLRSRAPITVKKDTLEFNVSSFKTKKDANIEDLLKELPGVEVDDDGTIRVNGKEVNKILVNGKPFFGNDPTIATRNLTKDIIEKIQVTDTKTDDEAFAGEEGDKENKTINLTIKEENNKGVFGRLAAGGGTDNRFEYAGLLNIFNNDRRISFLGGGNNINNPGFSFGEIRENFGGNASAIFNFGGGPGGIVTSRNAGVNYADELAEGFDITANYFYSAGNNFNETTTERENILPDQRFFTNSNSRTDGNRDGHTANITAKIEVDSTFLITINPRFEFNTNRNRFRSSEVSLDEAQELINSSTSQSNSESTNRDFENTINLTKRFGENGAFLKFRLNNTIKNGTNDNFLNSTTLFNQQDQEDITRDQFTDGDTAQRSFRAELTYRYPVVAQKLFLDFKFSQFTNREENRLSTFEFDPESQSFSNFNDILSTDFTFINRRTTPSVQLSYKSEKWGAGIQGGYVFRNLENRDLLRPELNLDRNFEAVELSTYFNYQLSPQKGVYAGYNLNNEPPRASQLSPFENVRDPLNTIQGNPDLEPTNTHRFYVNYNAFNFQSGSGFYLYADSGIISNAIVARTTIDENLLRRTTYENVQGNYNINVNSFFNKKIKVDSIRTFRYNYGFNASLNRNINFNNDVQYASIISSIGPRAGLGLEIKNALDLSLSYSPNFSRTIFDLDIFQNQNFTRHQVFFRSTVNAIKKWEWINTLNYNFNPNVADDFQRSALFWNSSVSYSVLKDKGKVSLKVYDLLNQNTNAQRTATENLIQDVQSTVLQQYFLVGFSWKFNSLGSKGEPNNNGVIYFD